MNDAIGAGCRACALLKEGLERFVDLDPNTSQVSSIWVGRRKIDKASLASLTMLDDKLMILELVDGSGDYFAANLVVTL